MPHDFEYYVTKIPFCAIWGTIAFVALRSFQHSHSRSALAKFIGATVLVASVVFDSILWDPFIGIGSNREVQLSHGYTAIGNVVQNLSQLIFATGFVASNRLTRSP